MCSYFSNTSHQSHFTINSGHENHSLLKSLDMLSVDHPQWTSSHSRTSSAICTLDSFLRTWKMLHKVMQLIVFLAVNQIFVQKQIQSRCFFLSESITQFWCETSLMAHPHCKSLSQMVEQLGWAAWCLNDYVGWLVSSTPIVKLHRLNSSTPFFDTDNHNRNGC